MAIIPMAEMNFNKRDPSLFPRSVLSFLSSQLILYPIIAVGIFR